MEYYEKPAFTPPFLVLYHYWATLNYLVISPIKNWFKSDNDSSEIMNSIREKQTKTNKSTKRYGRTKKLYYDDNNIFVFRPAKIWLLSLEEKNEKIERNEKTEKKENLNLIDTMNQQLVDPESQCSSQITPDSGRSSFDSTSFNEGMNHQGVGEPRYQIQDSYGYTIEKMAQFELNATEEAFSTTN